MIMHLLFFSVLFIVNTCVQVWIDIKPRSKKWLQNTVVNRKIRFHNTIQFQFGSVFKKPKPPKQNFGYRRPLLTVDMNM